MTGPSPDATTTAVAAVPDPHPSPTQVAIDVSYAGINYIDVMARRGDPGYATHWPYVPGLEVAGRIREVGSPATGFLVGQRVAAFTRGGGLAGIAVAEADLTVALPDAVTEPVAAAAPLMLATALLLLTDVTRLQAGDTVLMHSASGGIGSAVSQLVAHLGGRLRIGTVGRDDKVADAIASGWDVALPRGDDLADRVRLAAPNGVDVILDPAGTSLLELDLAVAAPGARIALFGNPGGGVPAPLPSLGRLIGGNVALAGFSMSRLTATAPARARAALLRVVRLLAEGGLRPSVSEVESLAAVPAVHDRLAQGQGSGKYVARVRS